MMATVNKIGFFSGDHSQLATQAELQRRQMVIDQLRKAASEPIDQQMVSGRAIPISPWQTAAKLFQAGASAYQQKKLDKDTAAASEKAAAQQAAALRAMAPQGELTPEWQQAMAAYQTDPELGRKLIEGLRKPEDFSQSVQYDQEGNAFVLGNRGTKRNVEGVKARDKLDVVNGVAMNLYNAQPGQILPQDPNKPFMQGAAGPVANTPFQRYMQDLAERGRAKTDVNVSVGTGDKKYAETRMGDRAKTMADLETRAENAYKQIQSLDRFIKASEKGNEGGAQPLITSAQNLVSSFGYNPDSLKDTRIMEQAIGDILGSKMAELGARGLTDKDMQILRDALPRVNTDKQSRVAISNILKKSHAATLEEYEYQRGEEQRIYPELGKRLPEPNWYRTYKGAQKKSAVDSLLDKYR